MKFINLWQCWSHPLTSPKRKVHCQSPGTDIAWMEKFTVRPQGLYVTLNVKSSHICIIGFFKILLFLNEIIYFCVLKIVRKINKILYDIKFCKYCTENWYLHYKHVFRNNIVFYLTFRKNIKIQFIFFYP